MNLKSSCLLLLLMMTTMYVKCQWYELNLDPCSIVEDKSKRCTVIYYCDGRIFFLNSAISLVPCASYYSKYDLILNYRNMNLNTFEINSNHASVPVKEYVKKIFMTHFDTITIPTIMLSYNKISHFEITYSTVEVIDFSLFCDKENLISINASHNRISLLESTKDKPSLSLHSLELIDLSFNLLETLPIYYFSPCLNLLHLNLSHNYIKQLEITTFEGLYHLKNLYLSYNNLITLGYSFVKFFNLQELMLNNNYINYLSKSNFNVMIHLEKINLSSNNITYIEDTTFQSLVELKVLDLSSNAIPILSKKSFVNNTKLEYLILTNNNIKTISNELFNAKNVQQFNVNNNSISGIIDKDTFYGIIGSDFDLSYNKIETVAPKAFSSLGSYLKYLNLSHNNIHNVSSSAFLSLDSLKSLDISFNRLENVDDFLKDMKMIKYLNFSNNSVKRLLKKSFVSLISLVTLDLSFNFIEVIENETFVNLQNLETLLLSNNPLSVDFKSYTFKDMINLKNIFITNTETRHYEKYAYSGLSNLQIINSSYGGLESIDCNSFYDIGSIQILDFSNNLLEIFIVKNGSLPELKELYLHNNRIQNISPKMFEGLSKLKKVTLAANNILNVEDNSFSSLIKLKYLDLSSNELMILNLSQIGNIISLYSLSLKNVKTKYNFSSVETASLKVLDMSFCEIDDVKARLIYKLANITHINLKSNKITQIDKHSFQTMPMLSHLDLNSNHIKYIQPGSFIHTNLITYLDLNNNELSSLQHGVFDGLQELEYLNLSSNLLRSFEINILYKSLQVSAIVLDDNYIQHINFKSFDRKNIKELSLGGNLISCDVLIDLKNHKYSYKVTAQTLDYHSENVNGITCKTSPHSNEMIDHFNNTALNITLAFTSLVNSMDLLRKTIIHSNGNVNNTPTYVTLVCLLLLFCFCTSFSYSYFKQKRRVLEINEFSSVRHLSTDIEME